MEDRGVGEKCFVCADLYNQWWSFILEMGEASICGRIHGINLDPCFLDFHADRAYLDLKTPLNFLRSLTEANGTGPLSRIWNAFKSHIHYPRFMEAMIESFGDFLRGNPLPKHFTDFFFFCPPEPKVGWTSLLSGPLKIPRHSFILWMAIQEKLPTTDRPWLTHLGGCILCNEEALETHSHLFFRCRFSRLCLAAVRRIIRVPWPNREWGRDIEWATRKWRGKHIINSAYRALLGSLVYHIWRERNLRRFQQIEHPANALASFIVDDIRQRILSINMSNSISTIALYRLWRIPWPVEG
ncbi:UNVERIFIED_CONTAM: hypothetical protein Sindi_1665800 [Sesamum indicum]